MTHTDTFYLLCNLLEGLKDLPRNKKNEIAKMNYTGKGCECIVEHSGQFYKITVEPVQIEGPVYV
jgi:hypothetical protein